MTVRSVAAKPLSFWLKFHAMDIKAHISPFKSATRKFLCEQKFFLSVQRVIGRHLEASCLTGLPLLPQVVWTDDIPVCLVLLQSIEFHADSAKNRKSCCQPTFLPKETFQDMMSACNGILRDLNTIICRL